MKLYSRNGKYIKAAKRKRPKKLLRLLLTLVLALVLCIAAMIGFLLHNRGAEHAFVQLASQTATLPTRTTEAEAPPSTVTTASTQTRETAPAETVPDTTAPKVILPQYTELYDQNPDLFGWLKIEGTKIDYPVMHAPTEREKYLHANFEGEYSYAGTPFLDETCTADSDNLLIYAHNMPNGSMFRDLLKYQEKNFWQAHPVIVFNTLYEEQEFEVLAAFYDRVYYSTETVFKFYQFIDAEDQEAYDYAVSQFKEKSLYDTGVEASCGDRLITLVTCAYHTDNGRFVVVAKKK